MFFLHLEPLFHLPAQDLQALTEKKQHKNKGPHKNQGKEQILPVQIPVNLKRLPKEKIHAADKKGQAKKAENSHLQEQIPPVVCFIHVSHPNNLGYGKKKKVFLADNIDTGQNQPQVEPAG